MRAPDEQFAQVGDVELCYDTFGREGDPAVLLIMGLGTQMLGWHPELCEQIAARGRFVIRYDNRDCGRSTWFDGAPVPSFTQMTMRRIPNAPYNLADMADDAAGLLAELGIASADVAGASMGGMIAQTLTVRRPELVTSLTSIMSNTGSRWTGQPHPRVLPILLRPAPREKQRYLDYALALFTLIGSPGFDHDEDELRAMLELAYERGMTPAGTGRQLGAIIASGNRTAQLRGISCPTTVIHGKADKLINVSGGRATAAAIPGSKLVLIDGMGHDLPREVWPQLLDAIAPARERETV